MGVIAERNLLTLPVFAPLRQYIMAELEKGKNGG